MSGGIIKTALGLTAGFLIWAAHFTLVYGLTALTCARGVIGIDTLRTAIIAATVLVLMVALSVLPRALRPSPEETRTFLGDAAVLVVGLAALSILWNAVPALVLPICR